MSASQTPHFDELTAEGGNPLGGPSVDLTPPKFDITLEPTEWPDINDVIGPPPPPLADPEATIQVPLVNLDADPSAQSALAALDNGALPTSATFELPAAEPLPSTAKKSEPLPGALPAPGPLSTTTIDLSEFDEPGAPDRQAPRREP